MKNHLSDIHLLWLRRLGMGFLLAAIFIPYNLLLAMGLMGALIYVGMRMVSSLMSHRRED